MRSLAFSDTYLQPDAPDPLLNEEVVVGSARRHAPAAGRLLQIDESGGEARAYLLEGGIVMKTQRPHRLRPRTSLEKEALFLAELERHGNIHVPRALGHGHVEGIEYICLTRVPGVTVAKVTLSAARRVTVLEELGRTMRSIHEIDQSRLAESDLLPGDRSAADLTTRFARLFDQLAASLDSTDSWHDCLNVGEIAAARLQLTPTDTPPVALHSNPGPEHTFVDPLTAQLTGLIDFGDAYRSHPALDLRTWTDPADARALLAGYESIGTLPPSFKDVLRTGQILIELTRAVKRQRTTEQTTANLKRLLN